jgi:hypothetical protein
MPTIEILGLEGESTNEKKDNFPWIPRQVHNGVNNQLPD